jgi:translocation and assembly module TamB
MSRLWRLLRGLGRGLMLLLGKSLRVVYVVLVTLLVVLAWLILTTSGAQWLAQRAMQEEPRLSVDVVGGNLLAGLDVEALGWHDDGLSVDIEQARLRWNPVCLLALRVCLDHLGAQTGRVEVDTATLAGENDAEQGLQDETGGDINLPLTISFPHIVLQDIQLRVDGHMLAWQDLTLGGEFSGKRLRLSRVRWQDITAHIQPPEGEPPDPASETDSEQPPDIAALLDPANRERIELPEIHLPIDLAVEEFEIRDARVRLAEREELVEHFHLSADLIEQRLVIRALELEHPQLRLTADGRLMLAQDYPLDLELRVQGRDLPQLGNIELEIQVWNTVGDLELRLDARGPGSLQVEGQLAALRPEAPHALDIRWADLRWPVLEPARFRSEYGELRLEGDLHGYALALDVALSGEEIPDVQIAARGRGDYRSAELELLRIDALDGALESAGQVFWQEGIAWDAWLQLDAINAVPLHPEAPDGISGELRTRGELVGGRLVLDVEIDELQARIPREDLSVRLHGAVRHRPDEGWLLEEIALDAGLGSALVAGRIHDLIELEAEFEFPDLNAIVPDVAGRASGTLHVAGPMAEPDVDLQLDAWDLAYGDRAKLATVELRAQIASLGNGASTVALELRGIEAPEAELGADRLALTLEGTRSAHRLGLSLQGAPLEAELMVNGGLTPQFGWEGELASANLDGAGMAWELEEALPVAYRPEPLGVDLGAHCWRYRSARLCADQALDLGEAGDAAIRLTGYELEWLNPWLPDELELGGSIEARIAGQWGDTPLPRIDAQISVVDGQALLTDPDDRETVVPLRFDVMAFRLMLEEDRLDLNLDLESEGFAAADVHAVIAVGADGSLGAVDGNLRLTDLDLGVAAAFFPELRRLEGVINADAALGGTLAEPDVRGQLRLDSGVVEPLAVPVTLSEIALQVDVEGNRAEIDGGFRSGVGEANLGGHAEWSDQEWLLELGLDGDRLEAAYEDMVRLRVSPDLLLRVRPGDVNLTGTVTVPRGEITIQRLPEGTVSVSPDVVFIDEELEAELLLAEDLRAPEGWAVGTDVEVVLGDRIEFTGFGLTGRIIGAMRVRQVDDGVLQANGELRIVDGATGPTGSACGSAKGSSCSPGRSMRPRSTWKPCGRSRVRRRVLAQTRTVVAGLRIEGRPEQPRVSLFSEPAMSDDDVLSYIILGRPVGESGPEGGNMMAQAALALGIAGGGGYATAAAEGLGIEDFEIDTRGEGDDTQFVVRGSAELQPVS